MKDDRIEKPDLSIADLKQAAVSGVQSTTAARVMLEVLNVGAAVALARLISPSQFGLAVVPLIFMPLSVILTFEGFGSALVQRKAIQREHVETSMLASLATGLALSAALYVFAILVGPPLFGEETAGLLRLISPIFILGSFGTVSRAMLWRHLDFRRVNVIEVVGVAIYAVSAVGMALAGFEAEALVLGALIFTLATSVLLIAFSPPPMPRWHGAALREVVRFGLPASGAGLTYVAISNATLAVGAVRLTAFQLGLFWRAFQIGVAYQTKISGIMMQIAFPVYSRTESIDELRGFHERATRLHAVALLPLLSLLIVLAPEVVPWVFGEQWVQAVGPVQILAVAGMIAAVLTGYTQILLAAGRPGALLTFNLFVLGLYLISSWFVAPYGLTALAFSVVGVHVVMMVAVYGVLFRRLLGIPIRRLLTDILPAGVCSAVMLAATIPLAGALRHSHALVPVSILTVTAVGALVYGSALLLLFRGMWAELVELVARVLPRRLFSFRIRRPPATGEV